MVRTCIAAATIALTLLQSSMPVLALTCVTELDEFDFMTGSPTAFTAGSREEVDRVYEHLRTQMGDLSAYDRTVIFVSGDFDRLVRQECREELCSGTDMRTALVRCVDEGNAACHPLAVAYRQKLYCLLSPGQDNFDPSVPFEPYIPFAH